MSFSILLLLTTYLSDFCAICIYYLAKYRLKAFQQFLFRKNSFLYPVCFQFLALQEDLLIDGKRRDPEPCLLFFACRFIRAEDISVPVRGFLEGGDHDLAAIQRKKRCRLFAKAIRIERQRIRCFIIDERIVIDGIKNG